MSEESGNENLSVGWKPSPYALQQGQRTYLEVMPYVNIAGLAGWLTTELQHGMSDHDESCRVYGDALYEISRLIDELRFEASLASVYITEFKVNPCAEQWSQGDFIESYAAPRTALQLLSPSFGDEFFLSRYFINPITPISGYRTLAGWYTAQLLDSAMLRAAAALDCIAVLLWCAARIPLITDHQGRLILPAFCDMDLEVVGSHYCSSLVWPSLFALTQHGSTQMVRSFRNGFIHQRRAPTELHGGRQINIRFGGDRAIPPVSPQRQLTILGEFYRDVLCAAITRADEVLSTTGQ